MRLCQPADLAPTGNMSETILNRIFSAAELRLQHAGRRIHYSKVPLGLSWFPEPPTIGEELRSSVLEYKDPDPGGVRQVETDFWEELKLIEEHIPELSDENLPDWQRRSKLDFMKPMWRVAGRRCLALALWSRYAVPLRIRNGRAFRIYAHSDAVGWPLIKSVPIDDTFADALCQLTAEQRMRIAALESSLDNWKVVALVAIFIAVLRFMV